MKKKPLLYKKPLLHKNHCFKRSHCVWWMSVLYYHCVLRLSVLHYHCFYDFLSSFTTAFRDWSHCCTRSHCITRTTVSKEATVFDECLYCITTVFYDYLFSITTVFTTFFHPSPLRLEIEPTQYLNYVSFILWRKCMSFCVIH